ncbi:MAG TPA: polyphosphate kinase 1 [Methanoregulaceae archaeon]|nr:polyphosphate kinase 1 [Methanoregulaceae archaeon]HPD75706.1 polyphosphate kinase 1 [Methanoregulaceae archaeon]
MTDGPDMVPELSDPSLYFNRELSWLSFNRHVLDEAKDTTHPLLERVKFLAIFANNLDEFFMIRVAGLQRQLTKGVLEAPPDGMTPSRQLDALHAALIPVLAEAESCWAGDLIQNLAKAGIHVHSFHDLTGEQKSVLRRKFIDEVFPVLTPLAFDPSHPFPFISNLSLNLAITVRDVSGRDFFARVKVPTDLFPRLIRIPGPDPHRHDNSDMHFVFIEEIIAANLDLLFPGLTIVASYAFRITRDADPEIAEDEASDLMTTVEEVMEQRRTGRPVRIEVGVTMPESTCHMLMAQTGLSESMVYRIGSPLGMADVMQLPALNRPDLKDSPFIPQIPPNLDEGKDFFAEIRKRDLFLFHPYDSFLPVVSFLKQAAHDPDVLAIKITLYRAGTGSPIVAALKEARENGKAVAAVIELKARFDEENNIGWARQLERAGVHVVYGVRGLKVHAKVCMVIRRESGGIRRYVHLGTGNYNAVSSRVYTDFSIFTCDPSTGADVADLFNFLTGYARIDRYRTLHVAPVTLRSSILERIDREIERHQTHGGGRIIFKMNALVDRECIAALYRASQAGVSVDLQVRGICCLRPGIPGISETIRVTTIVGRFLEHARAYYFRNGGDGEVLIGSADLMPRNLDRRVEILFPIRDPLIREILTGTILPRLQEDTVKLRVLCSDGTYERARPVPGNAAFDAQSFFIANTREWHG